MTKQSEKTRPEEKPAQNLPSRKIIAVGDLHGDYYRVIRILEEQKVLIPGTLVWNPMVSQLDLIFIGDYVDWRGEPLEGDPSLWNLGSRRLLKLLVSLYRQVKYYRENLREFAGNLYLLWGNHDLMMLDGVQIFSLITTRELSDLLEDSALLLNPMGFLAKQKNESSQQNIMGNFFNWYFQGGDLTIQSFGGVESWKQAMEGEIGNFLRENLVLGVKINEIFFSHSLPDRKESLRPLEEIITLPEASRRELLEQYVWGRTIWGYNYQTRKRLNPPPQEEIENVLSRLKAKSAVVGHTPMKGDKPFEAYQGKIINIDQHGFPGSSPWIFEWQPSTQSVQEGNAQ